MSETKTFSKETVKSTNNPLPRALPVEMPQVQYQVVIVEVPEIVLRDLLRQVPIPTVDLAQKEFTMPTYEYAEQMVEVPQLPMVQFAEQKQQQARIAGQEVAKRIELPVAEMQMSYKKAL